MKITNLRRTVVLKHFPNEQDSIYVETILDIVLLILNLSTCYLITQPGSSKTFIMLGFLILSLDAFGSIRHMESCALPGNFLDKVFDVTHFCGCLKSLIVVDSFVASLWVLVLIRKESFT